MSNPECIRHVVIRGRVQRVGFRAWTEYTANDLGLAGWVRNRRDGAVEAVFAGPAGEVAAMVAACRSGPPGARVEAVDQREASPAELALRNPGDVFSVLETV
jgi:acylphosphatase